MTEPSEVATLQPDAVAAIAREVYAIEAQVERLPGEYDQNYRLVSADGSRCILKLMHPSREPSFIDLQVKALQHLAARTPSLPVPKVLPTAQGEAWLRVRCGEGDERIVWLLGYLPGKVMFEARPHSTKLLEGLGELLGAVDTALQDFHHPAAKRDFKWDLAAALWIREHLGAVADPDRRARVARVIDLYEREVVPQLPALRKGVIYGDANDYNVLVNWEPDARSPGVALIDFGDMHEGLTIAEVAVAAAYALLGKDDPLAATASVLAGFNRILPLQERELQVLFPLVAMRLAVSVVNSARVARGRPDDPYVTISEAPAWAALEQLGRIHPRFAHYLFRHVCGFDPLPGAAPLADWLARHRDEMAVVIDTDFLAHPPQVLDLGIGSTMLGADPARCSGQGRAEAIAETLRRAGSGIGVGRHDEARHVAGGEQAVGNEGALAALATVHLGMEFFAVAGTAVHTPLDAVVHGVASDDAGSATVVLRHAYAQTEEFFTLYRHVSPVPTLASGQRLARGESIGKIAPSAPSAPDTAHLHFQLAADLLDRAEDFPVMVPAGERALWNSLSPDPNLIVGIARERFPREQSFAQTLERRHALLGGSLGISYRSPLKIVRGWRQHLYDDAGRPYLDMFNNVPLVGHGHPRIVEAVSRQLALLNSNTRYLHDTVLDYAERLTELLPDPLRVCYFVNSGSEANELAIRMARVHTGAEDILVLENAYHGNTGTVTDISPYKFNGPGGTGRKPWVHVAPIADDYRGTWRRGEQNLGARYAEGVASILDEILLHGGNVAAYIAESMPSVGGQIVFPDGYLDSVYRQVRAAGGVCIADEVQVGFGRLGSHFWGFETQGVVPDIVVLAKPIGNCFPLAAVVTTPEIAASFNNGMEFFSTYGGNPVSCAAGLAVLDVLRDERLPENASRVGGHLIDGLRGLQARHPLVGDVRGMGLFLGVDLVTKRETRAPATAQAAHVVNRLRDRGVLAGTDGPFDNVIKLRPPLILSNADADRFLATLDDVLQEDLPPSASSCQTRSRHA